MASIILTKTTRTTPDESRTPTNDERSPTDQCLVSTLMLHRQVVERAIDIPKSRTVSSIAQQRGAPSRRSRIPISPKLSPPEISRTTTGPLQTSCAQGRTNAATSDSPRISETCNVCTLDPVLHEEPAVSWSPPHRKQHDAYYTHLRNTSSLNISSQC